MRKFLNQPCVNIMVIIPLEIQTHNLWSSMLSELHLPKYICAQPRQSYVQVRQRYNLAGCSSLVIRRGGCRDFCQRSGLQLPQAHHQSSQWPSKISWQSVIFSATFRWECLKVSLSCCVGSTLFCVFFFFFFAIFNAMMTAASRGYYSGTGGDIHFAYSPTLMKETKKSAGKVKLKWQVLLLHFYLDALC